MSVPTPILQYNLSDATMKGLLPAGYTPLAYIESTTSNQYIDTGFKYLSGNITIDCEYTVPSNNNATIFGSSNDNTKWLCLIYKSGSNSLHYCGTINGSWANGELSGNKRKITYSISGTTCTLNDGKLSVSANCGTIPAQTYSYTLWCHHYSNTFTQYAQNARIYYFRLIYQGNLTLDYRPARRDSDGVIGMYDLVSRTFKTNSGSGTFIAGPELAVGKGGGKSLPEEYLLVEYLYNEDKTSWINFNRTLKSNTIMKVNMQVASYTTGAVYQQVMGYATNTSWKPYSLGIYNNVFILYSGTVDSTALPTSNFRQVVWTNSEETAETSGSTLGLFHMAGSPGDYTNAGIKVQCCQILEGSSIIIKAFPCYRKSDMKPGMYDTVNGVFYTNAGSGEFILGPTITNCYTWEPNASGKVALNPYDTTIYTESDGSRWMRIFHHNNPTAGLFSSSDPFTTGVYKDANRWMCIHLLRNKDLGSYEFMFKEQMTSGGTVTTHRWIQEQNPWTATWNLVKPGNILNVLNSPQGGLYVLNSNSYFVIANSSNGNWYGAIGCYTVWENNGIPAYPNGGPCTTGYMDLYVRIDNNTSFTPDGLYTNLSGIYDSSKGWVADFTNNTTHLSATIPAIGNNFSVAWWELSSNFNNDGSMPWGIYPFNPLYLKCLNTGDGSANLWYKPGTTTAIDNISNNVWHHFVVTGNGSANYLYVDGVKYGLSKAFKGLTGTSLVINGWLLAADYCRNPKISNFQIFNVALTDAQVKELYGK